jgi:hypothetical protein
MRKDIFPRLVFIMMFCQALQTNCLAQDQLTLNLEKLTLNNLVLRELNLDKITDFLGRPTGTNNNPIAPEIVDISGAEIYYHKMGLKFWFNPPSSDSQKRLLRIEVYLVRT